MKINQIKISLNVYSFVILVDIKFILNNSSITECIKLINANCLTDIKWYSSNWLVIDMNNMK